MSVVKPPQWMVSCAHVVKSVVGGEILETPFAEHHARKMGEVTTACGLPAFTWTNLYHRTYVPKAPGACPRCDAVVRPPAPAEMQPTSGAQPWPPGRTS